MAPGVDLNRFALNRKETPDNVRPHKFTFSRDPTSGNVVMDYFHWCHERETWNSQPLAVFNYVPDLGWLKAAKLEPSKLAKVQSCVASGFNCPRPQRDNCPCCQMLKAFSSISDEGNRALYGADYGAKVGQWHSWFKSTNDQAAAASLPKAKHLSRQPSNVASIATPVQLPPECTMPGDLPPPVRVGNALDPLALGIKRRIATSAAPDEQLKAKRARMGKSVQELLNEPEPMSCDGHEFERIVGARRDPASGNVDVAIIWKENNYKSGGSWEPIENVELQEEPPACLPRGASRAQQDALSGEAGAHAKWGDNFGAELGGAELLVQWAERKSGKKRGYHVSAFVATLVGSEFDHPNHLVDYPKQGANKEIGTSADRDGFEHTMNLATLATDMSTSSDCRSLSAPGSQAQPHSVYYLKSWVLLAYIGLKFIWEPKGLNLNLAEDAKTH